MSAAWADRRHSERFAELADGAIGPRHRRDDIEELAELVQLTQRLRELPDTASPDPEFRSSLRSFLVATAEREGIGASAAVRAAEAATKAAVAAKTQMVPQLRGTTSGKARAVLLAGAAVGALLLSGVSAASTDSLPGDPLYQVKRSSERAQIVLAGSDLTRGQLYLDFAAGRLGEAEKVPLSDVASVLADMDVETRYGVKMITTAVVTTRDRTGLDWVGTFVTMQRDRLTSLQTTFPVASRHLTTDSLGLLDKIEGRIKALRTALTKPCPNPTSDDLGPNPESC